MYALTRLTLGNPPKIEIDANRYAELKNAKEIQVAALHVEAIFEMLIRNYKEFEREILTLTLAHVVRDYPTWAGMFSDRFLLIRRLANLLTTARLYIDQAKHTVSSSSVNLGCTKSQVEAAFSRQYDKLVGYRIMEALRNHIQHRGVAVMGVSYLGRIEEREDGEPLWNFGLDLMLDMESLRRDESFKESVLREIELLPQEKRDLVLFVRQYVEGLGHVQEQLCGLIQSAIDVADDAIDKAVTDWTKAGHDPIGLSAVRFREDSTAEEHVYVLRNTKEKRAELVAENGSFANFSRRFVSSARKREAYPAFHRRS